MSTEAQRRLAALERRLGRSEKPCEIHFPAVLHNPTDEEIDELLATMDECPRCGPAKVGEIRVLILRRDARVVDPFSVPPTAQDAPTDDDSGRFKQ